MEIGKSRIYQYQSANKSVSPNSKIEVVRQPIYVQVLLLKGDLAKCRVLLIRGETEEKFKLNGIVWIPVMNLTEPDLFPRYAGNRFRWLTLVKQPLLDSTEEILDEISPTLAWQVCAAFNKRDLKVGQKWENSSNTLVVEKQWSDRYIVRDKFGDRVTYRPEDLAQKLDAENYKLAKTFDLEALLKSVSALLIPFMGVLGVSLLIGLVRRFLTK